MDEVTGLEAELRSNGISVEEFDPGEPLSFTYMTAFPGESIHHGEVGRACNTLIDAAGDGDWDPVRVEATVVRAPGDVQGTWHLEPEWVRDVAAGDLTETEFSARVLETLEES